MISHLYFNEKSDYSEENTCDNEVFAPPFSTIFRLQLRSYYIQYYNRKSRLVQMRTLQKTKRQKKIVFIDR